MKNLKESKRNKKVKNPNKILNRIASMFFY